MQNFINFMLVIAIMSLAQFSNSADPAQAELDNIQAKVSKFKVINIKKASGDVTLKTDQSLTIDDLRSIDLDDSPPILAKQANPYDPSQTDDYPPGKAPYIARNIKPFGFKYFNCEFNYGGWHNFAMMDYASAHGFNILYPYIRKIEERSHLPEGTQWMMWGGYVDWDKWLTEHNIPAGRLDMLMDIDVTKLITESNVLKKDPSFQSIMIDMEHAFLMPDQLRKQSWYPSNSSDSEKQAFERKYYDGYAQTYIAPVESARLSGWKNISLYGWEPSSRGWWGLEKVNLDPKTDWAWNAYGKQIYESVDILNPSVYCFYWSPQNVSYTLANIDLNMKMVNSTKNPKPIRPYYWTLLHGGGSGERWWSQQPLANEEARAIFALGFFTGFDGFVLWNWSGTGNHHVPPPLKIKDSSSGDWVAHDAMVKDDFQLKPDNGSEDFEFKRYDVLRILDVDENSGIAHFQRIEKDNPNGNYGIADDKPKFSMPSAGLINHLRASSEPISAMIEGMAIAKPFEYILRHGEVKIDVSAQQQFGDPSTPPIVRRVKLGRIHIIATYDPKCIFGGEPRQIILKDFDGNKGLILTIPADAETRIFVISI